MRIWRVDDKEQTDTPQGILIARDGKGTPSAPVGYPHKVEFLDTHWEPVIWREVRSSPRNYEQELATVLHSKLCRSNHEDQCAWYIRNFNTLPLDATRRRYLDKAEALLEVIRDTAEGIPALEAYQAAVKIVGVL